MSAVSMVSPITRGKKHSATGIDPVIETITPRRAAELLTLNVNNRRVRQAVVERYARDMAEGRWNFDGSPIRISDAGMLLDGQHRLTAVVDSGVTIPMLVIYDLPADVRDSMDTGLIRQASDVLQFNGYTDTSAMAAIARIVMARQAGHNSLSSYRVSNVAIHQWVRDHPEVTAAVQVYFQSLRQVPAAPSVVGAAYFLCAQKSEEAAQDFFVTRLIGIEGLSSDDPVRALRARLTKIVGRDSYAIKMEQLRFIILAWNIDREGRSITTLRGPVGGWTRENFPEPR